MYDFLDTSFKRRAFAKALKEVEAEGYYINQYYTAQNAIVLADNAREIADLNSSGEKKAKITEQVLDLATLNEKEEKHVVAEPEMVAPTLANGVVLEPVETLQSAEQQVSEEEFQDAYRIAKERADRMYSQPATAVAVASVTSAESKEEPAVTSAVADTTNVNDTIDEEAEREKRRNEIRKIFLSSILDKQKREAEKAKAASALSAAIVNAKKEQKKETVVETKKAEKPEAVVEPIKEAVKKLVRKNAAPRKRRRRFDADIIGGYY